MSRNIMVPLDGTRFAEAALPVAMYLANRDDAALELVTVWAPWPFALDNSTWFKEVEGWEKRKREEERRYMSEVARRVRKATGKSVSIRYLLGQPDDQLAKYAAESNMDLVVMATHGHGPVNRAWLGSVADRMVRRSSVPVLLVRPDEANPAVELAPRKPFRKILVPMDGSALAEQALQESLMLGHGDKSTEITLLTVVGFPPPLMTPEGAVAYDPGPITEAQKEAAEVHLAQAAKHMASWGCKVTTQVIADPITWKAIVDYASANHFDLIAMATHGRGGVARLLLGSVADKVVRSSPVPTLLVHPAIPEKEGLQDQLAGEALVNWP
jgi:nucleotide-binding universal stress UspA family protein